MAGSPSFMKRQKERARQEKKRDKLKKKEQRKAEKEPAAPVPPGEDPDIAGIVPGPQPLLDEMTRRRLTASPFSPSSWTAAADIDSRVPMTERISIDRERLCASIDALGRIGCYRDERTGLTGVNRLALTAADGEGRRHVVEQMRALGLAVTVDRIGNVYARREGRRPDLAPVMMGSHIDSVQTAGRFDGCLGVLGGLEVLRTLEQHHVRTLRPLVVAFFTDEEGSRFGTDMLGSAVATGRIDLETAYGLQDKSGLVLRDELSAIGFLGEADVRLAPPHAYVECHIEQGPVLRAGGFDIGIVTGVQAISWHELAIVGKSAHAGTTPMSLRADPSLAAARINVKLREMTLTDRYGDGMRATMGAIAVRPGLVNVVPAEVVCSVDLRNPDDASMSRAETDIIAFYAQVAREENVKIDWRQTARTDTVHFSDKVMDRVLDAAQARNLAATRIVSGAGHDAQELSRLCPTGMVFVPGEYDGISHNPREHSTPEQCENGVNVLFDVVLFPCRSGERRMNDVVRVALTETNNAYSRDAKPHRGPESASGPPRGSP